MKNLNLRGWTMRAAAAGLALTTMAAAQTSGSGLSGVRNAMTNICGQLMGILPPLSMLLVVLAAIFYASGKLVPNPEFAGRAAGLAAAAVAASVICLVIVLILPSIITQLYSNNMQAATCTATI